MAPGSRSKRVRASDESQVPPSRAETRSTKRAQTAERNGDPVQDPTDARDDIPDNSTTPGLADQDRTPRLADHEREPADEDSGADGLDTEGK